ncbi:hypothetical protein ES705_07956 [subsurface metagenome]
MDDSNSDPEDENTVFEGNYMSNIAPQLHYGFNGSGGLWYKAERWVQDDVVGDSREVWIFSGGIVLDDRSPETVGGNNSIYVPDLYYKVVIMDTGEEFPKVITFLFPHFDAKEDYKEKDILKYTVSVDYLEALTGYNFFNEYSEAFQVEYEAIGYDKDYWIAFFP